MSADAAAREYTLLCDSLISADRDNKAVENAVIELEVAHKNHINAIKRDFNEELDKIEKHAQADRAEREADAKKEADEYRKELTRVSADYEKQFANARESYQRDIQRVKSTYDSIMDDKQHKQKMVSQINEDHAKELKRVREEYERIIGNKDKEIARLNRRFDEGSNVAEGVVAEADRQRRIAEEDASMLKKTILDNEIAREELIAHHRDEVAKLAEQQERIIRTSTSLLNQFQAKSTELEVELSKVRAMMFDKQYNDFRARLQSDAAKSNGDKVQKEMEELDARNEKQRAALSAVMERAVKAKEDQERTLKQYEKEIGEEMEKLRGVQREKEQKGDNMIVTLPSGAVIEFKTFPKSTGPPSSQSSARRRRSMENDTVEKVNSKIN